MKKILDAKAPNLKCWQNYDMAHEAIFVQFSISIPPESVRKSLVFCFQGV